MVTLTELQKRRKDPQMHNRDKSNLCCCVTGCVTAIGSPHTMATFLRKAAHLGPQLPVKGQTPLLNNLHLSCYSRECPYFPLSVSAAGKSYGEKYSLNSTNSILWEVFILAEKTQGAKETMGFCTSDILYACCFAWMFSSEFCSPAGADLQFDVIENNLQSLI